MDSPITRQTAYYCFAKDVLEGEYVRREGWEPNFVASPIGALSRVRLAGVIIDAPSPTQYLLDDGSAKISLNVVGDVRLPTFSVGQVVMVIGRPRESGTHRYIAVEILRSLPNPSALKSFAHERTQLLKYIPAVPAVLPLAQVKEERIHVSATKEDIPASKLSESSPSSLLAIIRQLDPGDGASMAEVLARAGPGGEQKLQMLINEGEVFELRAGKVKVLE